MKRKKLASPSLILDSFQWEEELQKQGFNAIAGVDEAGRGPLAGPVVAAAIILPSDRKLVSSLGIQDSKKVSPKNREEIFENLKKIAVAFGIGVVDHRTIDEINILQATYTAMRQALFNLKISCDYVLVDGYQIPALTIPQQAIIKGDSKILSIAAASIIAKVTRDCLMQQFDEQFPQYGFGKHKGYGTQEHLQRLMNYGPCEIHRKSFRPVREIV
ncbi:MAG: ribonuclease HII [Candidatus Edwardsbacteria bacterium]